MMSLCVKHFLFRLCVFLHLLDETLDFILSGHAMFAKKNKTKQYNPTGLDHNVIPIKTKCMVSEHVHKLIAKKDRPSFVFCLFFLLFFTPIPAFIHIVVPFYLFCY